MYTADYDVRRGLASMTLHELRDQRGRVRPVVEVRDVDAEAISHALGAAGAKAAASTLVALPRVANVRTTPW